MTNQRKSEFTTTPRAADRRAAMNIWRIDYHDNDEGDTATTLYACYAGARRVFYDALDTYASEWEIPVSDVLAAIVVGEPGPTPWLAWSSRYIKSSAWLPDVSLELDRAEVKP